MIRGALMFPDDKAFSDDGLLGTMIKRLEAEQETLPSSQQATAREDLRVLGLTPGELSKLEEDPDELEGFKQGGQRPFLEEGGLLGIGSFERGLTLSQGLVNGLAQKIVPELATSDPDSSAVARRYLELIDPVNGTFDRTDETARTKAANQARDDVLKPTVGQRILTGEVKDPGLTPIPKTVDDFKVLLDQSYPNWQLHIDDPAVQDAINKIHGDGVAERLALALQESGF